MNDHDMEAEYFDRQERAHFRSTIANMEARRDRKVLDFLRWLNAQGGWADAYDERLDQWAEDREPTDTLNLAFEAKLAVQRGDDDYFTIHLLPEGALLLAERGVRLTEATG